MARPAQHLQSPRPEEVPDADATQSAVTVVICAYTLVRWEETRLAVASVLKQRPAAAQLLLVVDHNPELAELARRELAGVTVLENSAAAGLSGARSTGLQAATQPITVFLDDDAEARDGWLASLVGPYREPEVIATGGGVVPRWWSATRPTWLPPEFDWVVGCSYAGLPETVGVVRNPIGANMSVRTQPALELGGFDDTVGRVGTRPRGCEETELAIRLTAGVQGSKVVYVPSATVDHYVPKERTRLGYFLSRCWHEGQSKAAVVRLVGASSGLQSERRHAAVKIPASLLRDLRSLLTGDLSGGKRMAVSICGLSAAAGGYLAGRLRQ